MRQANSVIFRHSIAGFVLAAFAATPQPKDKEFTSSIGMRFVRIEAGAFVMGFAGPPLSENLAVRSWRAKGDFDEQPNHCVRISKPFYMGAFEVTNAQYVPTERAPRSPAGAWLAITDS